MTKQTSLYRYTSLPALMFILHNKKLTLLNPNSWDDENDRSSLAEYKRKKNLKTLLALCFTQKRDTYHHWNTFTEKESGIKIEFRKTAIVKKIKKDERFIYREVIYKKIGKDVQSWNLQDLPFIKRYPYRDEDEFRIIFADKNNEYDQIDIDIKLEWIKRITASPWMPKQLAKCVKETIKQFPDCSDLEVKRSSVIINKQWVESAKKAI